MAGDGGVGAHGCRLRARPGHALCLRLLRWQNPRRQLQPHAWCDPLLDYLDSEFALLEHAEQTCHCVVCMLYHIVHVEHTSSSTWLDVMVQQKRKFRRKKLQFGVSCPFQRECEIWSSLADATSRLVVQAGAQRRRWWRGQSRWRTAPLERRAARWRWTCSRASRVLSAAMSSSTAAAPSIPPPTWARCSRNSYSKGSSQSVQSGRCKGRLILQGPLAGIR